MSSVTAARGHVLRFFLGPVQGFIKAGRRTRDLWAGSFLLSLLSGEAMAEVRDAGGSITLPAADGDETFNAILAARRDGLSEDGRYRRGERDLRGPLVGTLVNHFRAEVPVDFDPRRCAEAVRRRFAAIADAVFDVFIEPALARRDAAKADEIRTRWAWQTGSQRIGADAGRPAETFFEAIWVKAEAPAGGADESWQAESRWLDLRKTWRTHRPPTADPRRGSIAADRCAVYAELAELGGYSRVSERVQQDEFWEDLRRVVARRMYQETAEIDWREDASRFRETLEIRDGERLSAVALVKRLFPLLAPLRLAAAVGWVPTIPDSIGNPDPKLSIEEAQRSLRNWPSTAFVAAIPWIVSVAGRLPKDAGQYASDQYRALRFDPVIQAERPQRHKVKGIDALPKEPDSRGHDGVPLFAVLDGTLHFPRGLEWRRIARRAEDAKACSKELNQNFDRLQQKVKERLPWQDEGGPRTGWPDAPSPFYAFLEMDGDGMGRLFSSGRQAAIAGSRALLSFARAARGIVDEHDGVTIYAGADDVLALLPIETAIACAVEVRAAWGRAFAGENLDKETSISASIVFADYQVALDDVRSRAHERLDRVAKDGNGRDSIALAVLKSGGMTADWVSTWTPRPDPSTPEAAASNPVRIFELAAILRKGSFASRFAYLLDRRLGMAITGSSGPAGGEMLDDADLGLLVSKELADSGIAGADSAESRQGLADRIVAGLRCWRRDPMTGIVQSDRRSLEGLFIARFLAAEILWPYLPPVVPDVGARP